MNQVLTVESELVRAVVAGDFSLEEAKKALVELVECVERHGCKKVLVDGTNIVGNPAVVERFYYGSFAAHEVRRLNHRALFAYVLIRPVLDRARFGETVAVNRGMPVKTFDNVGDALEWLEVARK